MQSVSAISKKYKVVIMENSRRTRMTRHLIKEGLISLMEEKPIEKITVRELCERADVNRSTFYAHYQDIPDVLRNIENDILENIPSANLTQESSHFEDQIMSLFTLFFDYVKSNRRQFRILLLETRSDDFVARWAQSAFDKFGRADINNRGSASRYTYVYMVNGVVGLVKLWIKEDFPMDTKSFSRLVVDICFPKASS